VNVEEYGRMYEAEERQWWYVGMRALSFALLDRHWPPASAGGARPRLLDAGCGTGNNLLHLARRGDAVGVDVSDEALRFCRLRGVSAVRGSLLDLPFASASMDCVTSFDVIYHRWVSDDGAAVREMARVLRPGGLMLVRVPALRVLWGAHDEAVHSRHRYTRGELRRLLEGQGLAPLRLTYGNTFLLPLLLARRTVDRISGRHGSDVGFLPAPLEWSFRRLLQAEAVLLRRVSLPVGSSLFALARKG
jgi:SAM-dependent methyltransferase